MNKFLLIYFIAVNGVGMALNLADKEKAKRQRWRIKERTLWTVALLGGAPLSYLTMLLIRHKTKHIGFMVGMPLLAVGDIAVFVYLMTILSIPQ